MRSRTAVLVGIVLAAVSASARQPTPAAVSAWVATPAAGATWAAAYVEVTNPTMYDIYLTSASADVASSVELRAPGSGGGEPAVVKELTVPAYGSIAAAASAPHLRLVGLSRPLADGDTVQLSLTTDGGATLTVAAKVRQP